MPKSIIALIIAVITGVLITLAVIGWVAYALLMGDKQSPKSRPVTPSHITLHLGPNGGASFDNARSEIQPAGVQFRELAWRTPELGTVTLATPACQLPIPYVFYVLGTQYNTGNVPGKDGIDRITVTAGISQPEYETDEQAYLLTKAIIANLFKHGWRAYVDPIAPRILPEGRFVEYNKVRNRTPLTSQNYISYEEWQEVNADGLYQFYCDGVLLALSINAKTHPNTPNGMRQMLLRYEFQTVRSRYRESVNILKNKGRPSEQPYISVDDNELWSAWQSLYQDRLKERAIAEEKYRALGFKIEEDYQDPDVRPYLQFDPLPL